MIYNTLFTYLPPDALKNLKDTSTTMRSDVQSIAGQPWYWERMLAQLFDAEHGSIVVPNDISPDVLYIELSDATDKIEDYNLLKNWITGVPLKDADFGDLSSELAEAGAERASISVLMDLAERNYNNVMSAITEVYPQASLIKMILDSNRVDVNTANPKPRLHVHDQGRTPWEPNLDTRVLEVDNAIYPQDTYMYEFLECFNMLNLARVAKNPTIQSNEVFVFKNVLATSMFRWTGDLIASKDPELRNYVTLRSSNDPLELLGNMYCTFTACKLLGLTEVMYKHPGTSISWRTNAFLGVIAAWLAGLEAVDFQTWSTINLVYDALLNSPTLSGYIVNYAGDVGLDPDAILNYISNGVR